MANDIFGYSKEGTIGGIATPYNCLMSITGNGSSGTVYLAQNINISYQREMNPVYELGDDNVYMAVGQSSGSWSVSRAVGNNSSLLTPYVQGSVCNTQTLSLEGNSEHCGYNPGHVSGTGILQSVQVQASIGQLIVTDGATWYLTALRK